MKGLKNIKNLKDNFKKNLKNKNDFFDDEETDKKKIILYIIIIVILLLLLITSCTSGFFGKLGSLFRNEGNYEIDKDTNDKEEVLNQDLKFDSEQFEMSVSDNNLKISFSYKNINPGNFTCTTSDANIATCYVSDGYVIVNPKAPGEVSVFLQTSTNGKIYKASTKVTILEGTRKIALSSESGTIYLGSNPTKNVTFSLVGLSGEVTASSSDDAIATATVENGVLKIKALKSGSATITLSLVYNNTTYTAIYKVNVLEGKNPNASSSGSSSSSKPSGGSSSEKPSSPNEPSNPTNPDNPNVPENPDNPSKPSVDPNESVSTLQSLVSDKGTFSKNGNTYYLGVSGWTYTTTLTAIPTNPSATMTYTYKRADQVEYTSIDSLENLKLRTGDNIVVITVTSPDKTSTTTYTVVINKAYSSKNYLKDISVNGKTIDGFDKQTLSYELFVDSETSVIDFSATPWSKKATVTYTYNGVTTDDVSKLNLLTGPNSIKIRVTDTKGNTRVYSVIINRIRPNDTVDKNSFLKDLVVTSNLNQVLPIDFDPFIKEYNIGVDYTVEKVNFVATPSSNSDSVNVTFTYKGTTYNTKTLSDIALDYGNNEVLVTVTNNGSVSTYKVNINRATQNKSNTLLDLIAIGFPLNPVFEENTLEYKITVPEGTPSITLKGTVRTENTIITYNGNLDGTIPLVDGNNRIVVKVSDGTNERLYIVNVYRESSSLSKDASISSILVTVPGETTDRDITNTYQTIVTKDIESVKLLVTPTSEFASVTYNGSASGEIVLQPGVNSVEVVITAQDGTKKVYEVSITRAKETDIDPTNPILDKITINGEEKIFTNGETTAKLDRDEDVEIAPLPTDTVNITYVYNGNEYKNVNDLNKAINDSIHNGINKVDVIVSTKDGSISNTYTVNLIKDKSYLNMKLTGDEQYSLGNETIVNGEIVYNVPISYKENHLELDVQPLDPENSTITYTLNDEVIDLSELNNKLKDYSNTLRITVASKDGSVNRTYVIQIIKPTRKVEIVSASSECFLENDTVCSMKFKVMETQDGTNYYLVSEDIENISVQLDNDNLTYTLIPFDDTLVGEIKFTPNAQMTTGNVKVTLGIKEYNLGFVEKIITFKNHNSYELSTKRNQYSIGLTTKDGVNSGSKTIILYSQNKAMFNGKVTWSYQDKVLTIWDVNDVNTKIVISVNDPDNAITSLKYNPTTDELGPTSLPIEITAEKTGKVTLSIMGYVAGTPVNEGLSISLIITQKYIVNLLANGGYFDILNKEEEYSTKQSFELELGDVLAISKMEPFMPADLNNCTYYEFVGYSEDINATTGFKTDYTVTESTKPVTNFYAIYNKNITLETPDDMVFKTMWIFDPDLFINKAANNQTLIYPGANGTYTLNFNNTTGNKIKIIGLTLTEDTVCVDSGCLNMGYIIKYSAKNDNDFTYYLGNNTNVSCGVGNNEYCNHNYSILNGGSTTTRNTKEIMFASGDEITIENNSGVSIYLYWKWVDNDNTLDTLIGKKAALSNEEEITNKYSLNLGIHFKNVTDSCSLDNNG